MLGIGWEPIEDPAGAWPSGLALGPYGRVQVLGFFVSGLLLMVFAVGLHHGMAEGSKIGPALLFVAGAAMMLAAFKSDPITREDPERCTDGSTTSPSCSSCWPGSPPFSSCGAG